MKIKFYVMALGFGLLALASCEKHDPFDENTITGPVGPETYWVVNSGTVKAGTSMGFTGQYYSSVNTIDHSEVWYDLWEKEDKIVSAAVIKAFTYSYTSSIVAQKRVLQTIQSYKHDESLWSDSLSAFELKSDFPVSYTLAPITWVQPKDTTDFTKNLNFYFNVEEGQDFAKDFKAGVEAKLNPSADERLWAGYYQVFAAAGLMSDSTTANMRDTMPYLAWMTDSTFDENSASYVKHFKQYDSVFSTTKFDTINKLDTVWNTKWNRNKPNPNDSTQKGWWDTVAVKPIQVVWNDLTQQYDTVKWKQIKEVVTLIPWLDHMEYVYPQIRERVDRVWKDSVTFLDLISSPDGYAIEYQKSYYINAELRVYDKKGTYSRTDSKEIAIN